MSTSGKGAVFNMTGTVEGRKMRRNASDSAASNAPNLLLSPLMGSMTSLGAKNDKNYSIPVIVDAARLPFSQTSTIYKVYNLPSRINFEGYG